MTTLTAIEAERAALVRELGSTTRLMRAEMQLGRSHIEAIAIERHRRAADESRLLRWLMFYERTRAAQIQAGPVRVSRSESQPGYVPEWAEPRR